jgi:hypothetical protein
VVDGWALFKGFTEGYKLIEDGRWRGMEGGREGGGGWMMKRKKEGGW